MDRVLINTAVPISTTFYVDGVATDATGTVAVSVTREDGTSLITGTATHGTVGQYTFTLTPAQTGLLDQLTVQWTATIGGVAQTVTTYVQIVGGFLFSVADARARSPLNDTATYTTASIVAARTYAETELEKLCGAFVPRYARDTLSPNYRRSSYRPLRLRHSRVRTIRSLTANGVAWTTQALANLQWEERGVLWGTFGWMPRSVIVGYEYGRDFPPPGASTAGIELARAYLLTTGSQIDSRTTRIITEDGTLDLSIAGGQGRYGIPAVDSFIVAERERLVA
jgi:hypothetical protein